MSSDEVIQLLPTKDLIDELMRRHEVAVVIVSGESIKRRWKGCKYRCLGLMVDYQHKILISEKAIG